METVNDLHSKPLSKRCRETELEMHDVLWLADLTLSEVANSACTRYIALAQLHADTLRPKAEKQRAVKFTSHNSSRHSRSSNAHRIHMLDSRLSLLSEASASLAVSVYVCISAIEGL